MLYFKGLLFNVIIFRLIKTFFRLDGKVFSLLYLRLIIFNEGKLNFLFFLIKFKKFLVRLGLFMNWRDWIVLILFRKFLVMEILVCFWYDIFKFCRFGKLLKVFGRIFFKGLFERLSFFKFNMFVNVLFLIFWMLLDFKRILVRFFKLEKELLRIWRIAFMFNDNVFKLVFFLKSLDLILCILFWFMYSFFSLIGSFLGIIFKLLLFN